MTTSTRRLSREIRPGTARRAVRAEFSVYRAACIFMSRSPFLTLLGHGCEDPRRRKRPIPAEEEGGERTKRQREHPAAFNLATVDAIRLCWRRLRLVPSSCSAGKRSSSSLHVRFGTDATAPRRGKASSLPVVLFAVAASGSQLTQPVTRPPGKYRVMPAKLLPPRSLHHFLLISNSSNHSSSPTSSAFVASFFFTHRLSLVHWPRSLRSSLRTGGNERARENYGGRLPSRVP